MKLYAIRQKSTGFYLPHSPSHRGNTWTEPEADVVPRLYIRMATAKRVLSWWLRGSYATKIDPQSWSGCGVEHFPQPHRSAADMEIVQLELQESCGE